MKYEAIIFMTNINLIYGLVIIILLVFIHMLRNVFLLYLNFLKTLGVLNQQTDDMTLNICH